MNALIDFLPALLFLGTYAAYGIYTATAVLIVGMFALVAWYWFREHRLHKAHFITALVALVLGGLTIYVHDARFRSEEHTSELQSLMRNSYAVFCLKKKIIY